MEVGKLHFCEKCKSMFDTNNQHRCYGVCANSECQKQCECGGNHAN